MTYKMIVALADGGEGDAETLAFAAWLAARHGATARVLPVFPDAAVDLVALGLTVGAALPQSTFDALADAAADLERRIAQTGRKACEAVDLAFGPGAGPRMVIAERDRRPWLALSRAVVLADLLVIGQGFLRDRRAEGLLAEGLLHLRTPVLIGRGDPERLAGAVAVAWDGSPQAGRAVRAAQPLLAGAARRLFLQNPDGLENPDTEPGFAPLLAYLEAHGIPAGETVSVRGGPEGEALVQAAQKEGAGLLAAGAYGHSRAREAVFGGATRAFLGARDGPSLLLAH